MSRVFHRFPTESLPLAARAEGVYIFDADGRQYLDASGGAGVSLLGHGYPPVVAAIQTQLQQLAFAHTAFFSNAPAERLAELLVSQAPPGFGKVYFLSGGSETNEAALKLARQYHIANGEPARAVFIHRRQSYHGNTLGALAVSGSPQRRRIYAPLLIPARAIEPCYAYRHQRPEESEEAYGRRAAAALEAEIMAVGPDRVAAFIAEPVVGATLGAVPAVPGYFQSVREICDRHGVLLIHDEVMCGMGRTGDLFASVTESVTPDLITLAKGLGAGYQPVGALLVSDRVYDTVCADGGHFVHGHTYSGHPVACAAGRAVLEALLEDGLLQRVADLGPALREALTRTFADHPHVGDIRGRGLFLGLELVADRETKAPFDPSLALSKAIKRTAMQNGLICYPGSGTADGVAGDHILLAPPLIFEPRHIDELMTKLVATLNDVLP